MWAVGCILAELLLRVGDLTIITIFLLTYSGTKGKDIYSVTGTQTIMAQWDVLLEDFPATFSCMGGTVA